MAESSNEQPSKEIKSLSLSDTTAINIASKIEVIPLCVPLPSDVDIMATLSNPINAINENSAAAGGGGFMTKCVVGTVTIMKGSAVIWFGWGESAQGPNSASSNVGRLPPPMGPLVVSMPRSKYQGLSSPGEPACSQLISGENEDDQMRAWQMASRLSKKVGWPIFVSCSLGLVEGGKSGGGEFDGGGSGVVSHRAAALVEKEVGRILLERKLHSS